MSAKESAADVAQDLLAGTPDWPEPQPLPDELPPVPAFELSLLPKTFAPWITDIAERIQCPPDFPAVTSMITVAAVVGRKIGIRPKRRDNWLVVPNLWGAIIGPPSVMKTPAIEEPLRPLKRLEIEAKLEFEAALADCAVQELVAEQRKRASKSDITKALREGGGDPLEIARQALTAGPAKPVRRRYMVNDSTVEKLGEILNENPNGVLAHRDELIGLLKSLEKDGQEGARAFYLEAWDGKQRFTYDRIGRGTLDIEATTVSMIGTIQPGPLRSYLRAAVTDSEGADGLMQRFQLAVYPDISKRWCNVDRWPDTPAKNRAYEAIHRLDKLDPMSVGAEIDDSSDGIPFLRFDARAQEAFDAWRYDLEHRLRSDQDHPAIVAHLAKYRSLIPSLALLIHLAEGRVGPVTLSCLQKAIGWGRYLEAHARRIYSVAVAPDTAEAIALARKILSGDVADEFALRDIYRNGWIGLNTREAVERGAELLIDLDWLAKVEEPTPGRTRTRYLVNPKVRHLRSDGTDKTDKSPTTEGCAPLLSVLSVPPERKSACAAPSGPPGGLGS
jgi:putative DNA primase/helicase